MPSDKDRGDGPKGPSLVDSRANHPVHSALRDALKAVAGEPEKTPSVPRPLANPEPQLSVPAKLVKPVPVDPDKTALLDRRDVKQLPAAGAKPAEPIDLNETKGQAAVEMKQDNPTLAVRGSAGKLAEAKTQVLRGPRKPSRSEFHQEPVVGWLVVIGGPGLGAFRAIYEGNNTIGRAASQRIAVDFGDDAISAEEQAYLRYDSSDRQFLFVPNLAKTNVVAVNDDKPTGAVKLAAMDVITMGRTQLVFVPFCGDEFDWSELKSLNE